MRRYMSALLVFLTMTWIGSAAFADRVISPNYFKSDGWTYYPVVDTTDNTVYGFLVLLDLSQGQGWNLNAVYYQRLPENTGWQAYTWTAGNQYDAIKYAISSLAVTVTAFDPIGTEWGLEYLPLENITPVPLDKVAPADDFTINIIYNAEDQTEMAQTLKDFGFAVAILKPGMAALRNDCTENKVLDAYTAGVEIEYTTAGKGQMVVTLFESLRASCYSDLNPITTIIQQFCATLCTVNASGIYHSNETDSMTCTGFAAPVRSAATSGLPNASKCVYLRRCTRTYTRDRVELTCGNPCILKVCSQMRTVIWDEQFVCDDVPGINCPADPPCGLPNYLPWSDTGWVPPTCP